MKEGVMMSKPVIVSAVRTAIARQGGALASLPYYEYGAEVMKEAIKRANLNKDEIDDVIYGKCLSGGGGQGIALLLEK
jgi:acetyl-CoA C-acetyltransferase